LIYDISWLEQIDEVECWTVPAQI